VAIYCVVNRRTLLLLALLAFALAALALAALIWSMTT